MHNNRLKYSLLPALLCLAVLSARAQEEEFDSLLIKEVIVENPVYKPVVGFGAGIMNFYGDVKNTYINPMVGNYAFKVNVSAFIDNKRNFLGNFHLIAGVLSGNERSSEHLDRNLNFKSDIIVFGLNLEYNFGHVFKKTDPWFKPFISVGVENMQFSSKGDLKDTDQREYHYWSDGTIRDIDESQKNQLANTILHRDWVFETDLRSLNPMGSYSQNTFAVPVDIGIDLYVSNRVKMRLATSAHFTFTDLIDDVSWENENIENATTMNDHFSFTYLTMHLDLFSEPKVRFEELMFAELEDYDYTMFEDEDDDAVFDIADDCPGTPSGIEVDTVGCPYDDDQDGIPNYLDQEKNTPPGAIVDDKGIQMSDEEIIAMVNHPDAVARSDVAHYLAPSAEETSRMSLSDLPEKFHQLDQDQDGYLSFDEMLKAIDDFFDYESFLVTDEVYIMINFFFVQ